jgi:hypothetical protein
MQTLWYRKNKYRVSSKRKKEYQKNKKKICEDARRNRGKYLNTFRNYYFRKYHGITLEERNAIIKQLGSRCQICLLIKDLVIDHSHTTGQMRGMICGDCNKGLGWFRDSVSFLGSAIDYLVKNDVKTIAGA